MNFLSFLLKLNKALFVIKYLGPPGLKTLDGEIPGADIKSTFFTKVLGVCSSRNRIILGTTNYINAEPNDPEKRLFNFGYVPVPTKLMLASPSI